MKVFDTYSYNIADRVAFPEAGAYLRRMLEELGYGFEGLAFTLCLRNDKSVKTLAGCFPALQKYCGSWNFRHSTHYGATSFMVDWRQGGIYADAEDWDDILAAYAQAQRQIGFPTGVLLFNGVKWFADSDAAICPDLYVPQDLIRTSHLPFLSNGVRLLREYDDGNRRCSVLVSIDVTDDPEPRSSTEIVERLGPWLGEPLKSSRYCLLSKEEKEGLVSNPAKEAQYSNTLKALAARELPEPTKNGKYLVRENRIKHVADAYTLKRAFRSTGFEILKEPPNWMHTLACLDAHGFRYRAKVQKVSYCNIFRIWFSVSGQNFRIGCGCGEFEVTREGESLEILRDFAAFCVKVREEYGLELARDFGDTPAWYNRQYE